jgi:hypothetical protein
MEPTPIVIQTKLKIMPKPKVGSSSKRTTHLQTVTKS